MDAVLARKEIGKLTQDMFKALTVLITQVFLGMYVFLLIDFKQPVAKWKRRWVILITIVVSANIFLILTFGYWTVYGKVAVFTVTLPYILLTLWVSQQKGARVVFNIATCLFIGCIGSANARMVELILPQFPPLALLTRALTFLLLYWLLNKFRQPYLKMLYLLKRGWFILCVVPITTFLSILFVANSVFHSAPSASVIIIYGLIVNCGCAYSLIWLFFKKVYHEYEVQAGNDLLFTQVSALTGRIDAIQSIEDKLRIERHDLRHRLQTIRVLLEKEDYKAAVEYIAASQTLSNAFKPVRWCNNTILDATFGAYFSQAEASDIKLETTLDIPKQLSVDAAELSIVFANALENAIHACMALPSDERKIICKCISYPKLMLEISNPYAGSITLDSNGLPTATEANHGIGTRSIVAFTKKHNAFCDYQVQDGWFTLRISL